jgi:anti-sigma regulatory factor (Ser/Thr protein kinase)
MRDLSLHLLDIARNSIEAGATVLEIDVVEDHTADLLTIRVQDNGRGMDAATLERATDPFFTTRTTRGQGLGLSLLETNCARCEGSLHMASEPGRGTTVQATMRLSHLDRPPLGNVGAAVQALVCEAERVWLTYRHVVDGREFVLDTEELRQELWGGRLDEPAVLCWIARVVNEGLAELPAT